MFQQGAHAVGPAGALFGKPQLHAGQGQSDAGHPVHRGQVVPFMDAAREAAYPGRGLFIGQGPQGKAYLAVMRRSQIHDQIIVPRMQQGQGRGQLVTEPRPGISPHLRGLGPDLPGIRGLTGLLKNGMCLAAVPQ